jgi:putative ABC transport system substrate-binding protein
MSLKRRNFITLIGGAAAAWPLAARAQQPALPVIGFLNGASAWEYGPQTAAFRQGLSETGYVEGRNVLVEYRWAEGHYERLPTLAADLMRRQPAVIASGTIPATMAAKAATTTTPIVFLIGADPVEIGFVTSLNRPGRNLTGVTSLAAELGPKRVELLHELVPNATIIAALVNPAYPAAEAASRDLQAAARSLGLQLHVLNASSERDIDEAFATLVQLKAGGLVISGEAFFNTRSEQLAALSVRHAVPTISQYREFAAAGGLLSYGGSQTDSYRIAGIYAGRILKGEKPADLPVQRPTKVALFINLKTAKALGITFPLALLTRADEVIE